MNTTYLLLISSIVLLFSCTKEENEEPETEAITKSYIKLAEATSGDYTVKAFADEDLFEGYNKLYVEILDADNKSVEGDITVEPEMDMGMKQHSAPVEQPTAMQEDGKSPFAVVFIMPSGEGTKWMLHVEGKVGDDSVQATLDLPVVAMPVQARKVMYTTTTDSNKIFISMIQPAEPEVGMNEFEIVVHSKESMWSFPAEENFIFSVDPQMPDMDHGSPNNENPVHIGNGHYKGKVNFTMTGWWRVYLAAQQSSDAVVDSVYFDITF